MRWSTLSRSRRRAVARRCLPLLALLLLAGCTRIQARAELKKGNSFYREEHYREALAAFQKGLELDPHAHFAWRSVGLTALALYRPGIEGADNERYGKIAIEAFQKYLEEFPEDAKVGEYLLAMLVNTERYDEALARLEGDKKERPADPAVEQAIVNTLIKANRLDDALARLRRPGTRPDPQALYSVGVAAWAQSYGDASLTPEVRAARVELGLDAIQRALAAKPDYFEAMAYYNLLFREKAKITADPVEAQKWYAQAEEWTQKALALRERQQRQEESAAQPRS